MNDKKSGYDTLENVPAWVKGDPEVLADWLATDWDEDARRYREAGGRQNHAVIGGLPKPKREN